MIRCIDVRKTYRQGDNEITALAGITLEIPKGAFAVIMAAEWLGQEHTFASHRRTRSAE